MDNWIRKDLKYNWHPYTQMKDCRGLPPVLIEKAKGIMLYDDKGNSYYDTISSWWCNIHGHNHPRIKRAIKRQLNSLDHVLFAGFTHKPAILLAEKLVALTPKNLTKVFFSDNGSTAVETALKMSFQYWHNIGEKKKKKFISLDCGYHGDTIGAMSLGGVDLFNEIFSPLFFNSTKVPSPYCYRCPMKKKRLSCDIDCIKPLEEVLSKGKDGIAAFIMEPMILAAGGMIVYPKEYLEKAAALCRKYNIHLILDEVATGFGRTGKMFACEHAGIKPDFMCLSKGITSGTLALGATLTTSEVCDAFYADHDEKKTFYHGHTYTANPVACSAALASLEVFEVEGTLDRLNSVMTYLHNGIDQFRSLNMVGDIRSIGMIAALELVRDRKTKKEFGIDDRIGLRIYRRALKEGIILRPLGSIIYFYLPLCTKRRDIDAILDKAYRAIRNEAKS